MVLLIPIFVNTQREQFYHAYKDIRAVTLYKTQYNKTVFYLWKPACSNNAQRQDIVYKRCAAARPVVGKGFFYMLVYSIKLSVCLADPTAQYAF